VAETARRSGAANPPLAATLRRIERHAGALASSAVARMDETLPWFRALPADQRSWVMLVAQAGVRSLVEWLRSGGTIAASTQEISDDVFAAAPRALARSITLTQTVQLIKVTIDVAESQVASLAAAGEEEALLQAILKFSREIAFSAARVYARAAESRGAWDARLQALLVDALLRGDSSDVLASRAAALGWADAPPVAVVVGRSPGGDISAVLHAVYRAARRARIEVIGGVHGDRLVVVMGGATDPVATANALAATFGEGPVVVGPAVPSLDQATESAPAGPAGVRAAPARPRAGGGPARGGRAGPPPPPPRWPPTTCCPSGCWPATWRLGGRCGTTRTGRWPGPAAGCSTPWTPSSPPAGCWRVPPASCTCTPTRSDTASSGWPR
jgi:hypothetical protein